MVCHSKIAYMTFIPTSTDCVKLCIITHLDIPDIRNQAKKAKSSFGMDSARKKRFAEFRCKKTGNFCAKIIRVSENLIA